MKVINKRDEIISECAALLADKKIAILPTDTVYGLSGVIGETEQKIRDIKGRGDEKPFIILISKPEDVFSFTSTKIPDQLFSLWPGPLTIIVPEKNSDKTIAVRCPGDEWLRKLIHACGSPIYSTSVNRSGSPVIGLIKDIITEFGSEVDFIVDDGDCKNSTASTIVSISNKKCLLIRQGGLVIPEEVLK